MNTQRNIMTGEIKPLGKRTDLFRSLQVGRYTSLALCFLSTITCAPTQAAPVTPTVKVAKILTEANDPKLAELRRRHKQALAVAAPYEAVVTRYPVFYLSGQVDGGDAREIAVYGTAMNDSQRGFGLLMDKTWYSVVNANPDHIINGRFSGMYLFAGAVYGRNIYVPLPKAYFDAVAKRDSKLVVVYNWQQAVDKRIAELRGAQARRDRAKAQALAKVKAEQNRKEAQRLAALEANRRAQVTAQVERFFVEHATEEPKGDVAFRTRYADDSLAMYRRLRPRDEFPVLRENYVVQLVQAATMQARAGDLRVSADTASQALWFDAANAAPAFERTQFGNTAGDVFGRQPKLLDGLLSAWSDVLQGYVAKVEYGQQLRARKFSEVLLRCASPFAVSEKARLATVRMGLRLSSPSEMAPPTIAPNGSSSAMMASVPTSVGGNRRPALNFYFSSLQTGQQFQLKDFRGKVVVLTYFNLIDEDRATSPTPIERLFAISKEYDATRVVFLYYASNPNREELVREIKDRSEAVRAKSRNLSLRQYPADVVYENQLQPKGEDAPSWIELENFYTNRKGERDNLKVNIIDPQGAVAGSENFIPDKIASLQNTLQNKNGGTQVFNFNKDALDALIIAALESKG